MTAHEIIAKCAEHGVQLSPVLDISGDIPPELTITDNDSAPGGSMFGSVAIDVDTDHAHRDEAINFEVYSTTETDPPVEFDTVEWDFNYDGTTFTPDSETSGDNVAHAFATEGAHTVAARTVDTNGQTSRSTLLS